MCKASLLRFSFSRAALLCVVLDCRFSTYPLLQCCCSNNVSKCMLLKSSWKTHCSVFHWCDREPHQAVPFPFFLSRETVATADRTRKCYHYIKTRPGRTLRVWRATAPDNAERGTSEPGHIAIPSTLWKASSRRRRRHLWLPAAEIRGDGVLSYGELHRNVILTSRQSHAWSKLRNFVLIRKRHGVPKRSISYQRSYLRSLFR